MVLEQSMIKALTKHGQVFVTDQVIYYKKGNIPWKIIIQKKIKQNCHFFPFLHEA